MTTQISTKTAWSGVLPFEDTALAVTDTGGPGIPVIYLNGQFTTQFHWKKVIQELGMTEWRHITYDERARGKSKCSADYSFEAAIRDVDAVLTGRGVMTTERVVVVGWSYGAYVAAHWASRNPGRCLGAVMVDGAYPYDWLDEAMEKRIRKLFKRLNWFMPLLRPTGLAPRMTAEQQANSNIELGIISSERELTPVLHRIMVPMRYVISTGKSWGNPTDHHEEYRLKIEAIAAHKPNIRVSAKVPSNHDWILRNDSPAVVAAIREVTALGRGES